MNGNFIEQSEEQHIASQQQPTRPLPHYVYDVNKTVEIFADNGFRIAPRTVTSYCKSSLLDCEKYINGKVTKWKITRQSIEGRIETLRREGNLYASKSDLQPASMPASSSELQPAEAGNPVGEIIEVLKNELKEKNKQISEYQSIIHTQNKQFENLNHTIQLSNQTIQQLNNFLALPQMKDYVKSKREDDAKEFSYEVPIRNVNEEENSSDDDALDDDIDQLESNISVND